MLMNTTFLEDSFLIKWQSRVKTITNVVMIGAIPGGVSVDLAYALLDSYVQEAEKLSSVREIEMLCYNPTLPLASF